MANAPLVYVAKQKPDQSLLFKPKRNSDKCQRCGYPEHTEKNKCKALDKYCNKCKKGDIFKDVAGPKRYKKLKNLIAKLMNCSLQPLSVVAKLL